MSEHECKIDHDYDVDEGSGDHHVIRRYWACSCGTVMRNQFIAQWIDDNIAGVNKDNYK